MTSSKNRDSRPPPPPHVINYVIIWPQKISRLRRAYMFLGSISGINNHQFENTPPEAEIF